jgi:hypothetical protein
VAAHTVKPSGSAHSSCPARSPYSTRRGPAAASDPPRGALAQLARDAPHAPTAHPSSRFRSARSHPSRHPQPEITRLGAYIRHVDLNQHHLSHGVRPRDDRRRRNGRPGVSLQTHLLEDRAGRSAWAAAASSWCSPRPSPCSRRAPGAERPYGARATHRFTADAVRDIAVAVGDYEVLVRDVGGISAANGSTSSSATTRPATRGSTRPSRPTPRPSSPTKETCTARRARGARTGRRRPVRRCRRAWTAVPLGRGAAASAMVRAAPPEVVIDRRSAVPHCRTAKCAPVGRPRSDLRPPGAAFAHLPEVVELLSEHGALS